MEDIHLHSDLLQESEPEEQGDANFVMILTIIAMAALGIAWINYITLAAGISLLLVALFQPYFNQLT